MYLKPSVTQLSVFKSLLLNKSVSNIFHKEFLRRINLDHVQFTERRLDHSGNTILVFKDTKTNRLFSTAVKANLIDSVETQVKESNPELNVNTHEYAVKLVDANFKTFVSHNQVMVSDNDVLSFNTIENGTDKKTLIIRIEKNGKLIDNPDTRHLRVDIKTIDLTKREPMSVDALEPESIIQKITDKLNSEQPYPVITTDDITLTDESFIEGSTYNATIKPTSIMYSGTISFIAWEDPATAKDVLLHNSGDTLLLADDDELELAEQD